jgi:hypothetical protein
MVHRRRIAKSRVSVYIIFNDGTPNLYPNYPPKFPTIFLPSIPCMTNTDRERDENLAKKMGAL